MKEILSTLTVLFSAKSSIFFAMLLLSYNMDCTGIQLQTVKFPSQLIFQGPPSHG